MDLWSVVQKTTFLWRKGDLLKPPVAPKTVTQVLAWEVRGRLFHDFCAIGTTILSLCLWRLWDFGTQPWASELGYLCIFPVEAEDVFVHSVVLLNSNLAVIQWDWSFMRLTDRIQSHSASKDGYYNIKPSGESLAEVWQPRSWRCKENLPFTLGSLSNNMSQVLRSRGLTFSATWRSWRTTEQWKIL